ncbi:MAG: hypothetical protein M1383_04835 [Patescibacteria group bacterium]|nr:hypothetical protein [Patescibacteria group bacterium]
MKTFTATMVLLALTMLANAQTLITADTMGKGKTAAFVSANALMVKDFTTQTFSTAQVWRGVTDRIDVFGGVSETTALGQAQTAISGGANINLLKTKLMNISTFQTVSTPLNRRKDAAAAIWFVAGVVSHDFHAATLYGGYSATVPLGHAADKLFTPPGVVHNWPIGIAIPKGKFLVFAEYNFGKQVQTGGLGVACTF